jgi:hypothetical protein
VMVLIDLRGRRFGLWLVHSETSRRPG